MESYNTMRTFRCSICAITYETVAELAYHNEGHSNPSIARVEAPVSAPPQTAVPKRVRRKAMNTATFARFKYNLTMAISHTVDEFDPTPVELQLALADIGSVISLLKNIATRRTS